MNLNRQKIDFSLLKILQFFLGLFLFWGGSLYGFVVKEAKMPILDGFSVEIFPHEQIEQNPDTFLVKTINLYYRVNQTEIERDYMNNAYTLDLIDQVFGNIFLEDEDYIVIVGKASPEGEFNNNQRLAKERAISLKNYITQKYPAIKDNQIRIVSGGEDWEGLTQMIEYDKDIFGRFQLLQILNSNLSREKQKEKIKQLNNGKSYAYLVKHILPYLRGSVSGTIYFKKDRKIAIETNEVNIIKVLQVDTVYLDREVLRIDTVCPEEIKKVRNPFIIALKTNLVYDLALLPNLAIEFPLGRKYNWSLAIDGNWSWWNTKANTYYYHRIQIAGIEFRRWFANKTGRPLNGWFVGVYGYGGTYDIRLFTKENNDIGQLSNWSYSVGLTAGYAMPVAKSLHLEFGLGLGYFGGKYYKYNVGGCEECMFPKLSTHYRNYWGPTKLNVSLVWLIGYAKQNKANKEKEVQE